MSDEYFAGLFDGEGCVSIGRHGKKPNAFNCKATMAMTALRPLLELKEKYGGGIYEKKRSNPKWKDVWVWDLTGPNLTKFLKAILPYSLIKSEQIRLALRIKELTEVYKTRHYYKKENAEGYFMGSKTGFTKEEINERNNILDRMHFLNMRGKILHEETGLVN